MVLIRFIQIWNGTIGIPKVRFRRLNFQLIIEENSSPNSTDIETTIGATGSTIAELLAQGTVEAAEQLQSIAESASDKETGKAARKALYLLAQKGIVPSTASSSRRRAPGIGHRPTNRLGILRTGLRAYASAIDGAGNRLLFLTWPDPDGGSPTFLQALVSDEQGVKDIETRRIPRKELDERLEGFLAQLHVGIALAEIEPDYGRFLLTQATELTQRLRKLTPRGFQELLQRIGEPAHAYPESPVWDAFAADAILQDPDLNRDPEALFALEWFQAWFLDVTDVIVHLPLSVDQQAREMELDSDTSDENVHYVTEQTMNAALLARYRRRLQESADILRRRDQREPARMALYHALTLRDPESPLEIPFALALVKRTIGVVEEMDDEDIAAALAVRENIHY